MKKNLLIVALLAGTMTLPSCVDNNESPAVTAIRQAKVEQLQSISALNKANAEAALIQANADASLKEAQAAYQKALAALTEAQTETEVAKAQAEAARAKAEIETIAAQLQVDLENAKLALFQAQQAYQKALKGEEQENVAELSNLFATYQAKSSELLNIRQQLANAKITLAQLEADLINVQEARDKEIAGLEESIDNAQLQIEADSTALLTYEKYNTNTAEAQAELKKAEAARTEASQAYNTASQAYNKAYNDRMSINTKMRNNIYYDYAYNIMPGTYLEGVNIQSIGYQYGDDRRELPYSNTYSAVYTDKDGETIYIPLYTKIDNEYTQIEYTFGNNQRGTTGYIQYTEYYTLIDGGFDKYIDILTERVEDNEGEALADAQDAYAASVKAQATAQKNVDAQQKKVDDAEAAVKKAGDKATDAQKQALADAKAALEPLTAALSAAKTQTKNDSIAQNIAEDKLENVNKQLDAIKAKIATMTENAPAFQSLVSDYNAAYKNTAEKYVDMMIASGNYDIANAEYNALNNVVNGVDNTWTINNLKQSIETAQANIKNYKAQILALQNANSEEQAIESIENDIANYEAQITVLEKQVEAAKAALDAAMAPAE